MKIYYNNKLNARAKDLRKDNNLAEVILWKKLKGKQLCGYQFTRQKPIYQYIADFYCPKLTLVIEIDGSSHDSKIQEDKFRQEELESLGVKFLRFTDNEVKNNISSVLKTIEKYIDNNS